MWLQVTILFKVIRFKKKNWLIGKEFEFCLIDTFHSNPKRMCYIDFQTPNSRNKKNTDFAQGQGDWNCWRIDWICACSNQSMFAEVPLSLVCWLSKPPFFSHLKDAERMNVCCQNMPKHLKKTPNVSSCFVVLSLHSFWTAMALNV